MGNGRPGLQGRPLTDKCTGLRKDVDMVTQILLPKIGWIGMPRCRNKIRLGRWYKSNGAEIKADEVIAMIETPKAKIEIKAPVSGILFWMKKSNVKLHLLDVLGVVFDKL